MLNKSTDTQEAEEMLLDVIDAINEQDRDALKALFSEQALTDAEDYDGEVDKLFDFIQDDITSYELKDGGPGVSESNSHGHKTKELRSYYYLYSEDQEYFTILNSCTVDTDHPENVGLYLFLIVKEENHDDIYDGDKKIIYDGDTKLTHAGVYVPIM